MLEQKISGDTVERPPLGPAYLCLHGHFYQPPRENPFTGALPLEPEATPFANFNEKITSECYRPNAEAGNFDVISFDLGPTLAAWLEQAHPDVYRRIIEADQRHRERYGVGNALAQAYNHTILPLATSRDKRTQIVWGLRDFEHRYGHKPRGMWLAETAVDMECLDLLAQYGIAYTILAPWQAAMPRSHRAVQRGSALRAQHYRFLLQCTAVGRRLLRLEYDQQCRGLRRFPAAASPRGEQAYSRRGTVNTHCYRW